MRPPCPARPRTERPCVAPDMKSQLATMKKELAFDVEQEHGGFVAVCHEPEMATQGDTLEELVAMIRDLVKCRFDEGDEHLTWPVRLHFVRDPVLVDAAA